MIKCPNTHVHACHSSLHGTLRLREQRFFLCRVEWNVGLLGRLASSGRIAAELSVSSLMFNEESIIQLLCLRGGGTAKDAFISSLQKIYFYHQILILFPIMFLVPKINTGDLHWPVFVPCEHHRLCSVIGTGSFSPKMSWHLHSAK